MPVELRDYQADSIEQARAHIRAGRRRVLICAPTGAGKTVVGSHLVHECAAKGKRARFIVDRISLIEQTSRAFYRDGIEHGVIQGGHFNFHPERLAQVCSVQTLQRRKPVESHLTIIDEAHSLNKFTQAMLTANQGVHIGLSATPFTRGLGKFYDAIVNVTTTHKLIEQGWLVPYRIFGCHEADMSGVRVVAGEWQEEGAAKAALEVVGDVVKEYQAHGEGRKFICSGVNTDHCNELARQFLAAGINVAVYTYKEGDVERADTLNEFVKTDSVIRGLITVSAASKGFDCSDVGCIIMARPLRSSLAEHIQLLGRGLRISPETGKRDLIVLDHTGNCMRFWQQMQEFFDNGWSTLDDGKKKEKPKLDQREEAQPVKCPSCGHVHKFRPSCPSCGHVYPKKSQAIEHKAGTLKELIAAKDRKSLSNDLWPQLCAHARSRKADPDAAKRMALALYKGMTGGWPLRDFDATPDAPISAEVASRIRAQQIRFAKGRDAGQRRAGAATHSAPAPAPSPRDVFEERQDARFAKWEREQAERLEKRA
jgi:DNA repair protein RadD